MAENTRQSEQSPALYYRPNPEKGAVPASSRMDWAWARMCADKEAEVANSDLSIRVLSHPGGTTPLHKHDFFELIYVYRGEAENTIQGQKKHLCAGDMCLMNTNAAHSLSAAPDSIIFNLLISKDLLESSVFSLIRSNDIIASFFAESIHGIYTQDDFILFHGEGNDEARHILDHMICEYNERRSYYSTVMQAQLVWLLACLGRSFREIQLRAESGSYGPTISAIIEYMSDHCATATMESTAAHFHYNPSYFSRMIKKVTHSNFSDILLRLRLDRAADLLADTSLQIQEISDRTGFGSSSYFATAFKKRHGVSPAEYRRQTLKRRSGTAAD